MRTWGSFSSCVCHRHGGFCGWESGRSVGFGNLPDLAFSVIDDGYDQGHKEHNIDDDCDQYTEGQFPLAT